MIVGKKTLVLVLLLALFFLFGVTNGFCEGKTPEKVSLTVWVSVSSLMPIFESAISGFQKDYPGAEVEAVAFPLREAEKKFALAMSSVYTEFPQYKVFVDTAAKPGYVNMYKPFGPSDEVYTKFGQMLSKGWMDPSLVDNPAGIAKVISGAAAETDAIFKREGLYEK